jgi:hypothetical protein
MKQLTPTLRVFASEGRQLLVRLPGQTARRETDPIQQERWSSFFFANDFRKTEDRDPDLVMRYTIVRNA